MRQGCAGETWAERALVSGREAIVSAKGNLRGFEECLMGEVTEEGWVVDFQPS